MAETFDEQMERFNLMCAGDSTWDLSENDIAALCSIRSRIKELEAQLAALQWTEITEGNLPKVGDEIGCYRLPLMNKKLDNKPFWIHQGYVLFEGFDTSAKIREYGWTHFRPINAPEKEPK